MLVLALAMLQSVPPPVPPVAADTAAVVTAAPPTQERQQQPAPAPRWATSLDFGFASSSGNSDLLSLTTGFRVRHLQTRRFKLDWTAAFRYGQSQGEVVARNLQSKLDFDVGPAARVAPFVYASGERDPFRRLDLRARTGSGVRYAFYRGENGDASLRLAAQYSHERFTAAATRDPRSDAGWSMELKGQQRLGDVLRIENSSVFDPVLDDIGDFNLEVRSKVVSRVSKRMALTLTHAFNYDSTPPADVGTTDQRFQAGISIDF
jgi:hypothetical protein